MNAEQRIKDQPAERRLPSNIVPIHERRERRSVPRWIEYTQSTERGGKDLTGSMRDAA